MAMDLDMPEAPAPPRSRGCLPLALGISLVLHALPLALLAWAGVPLLLGSFTAGDSGWEHQAPVVWKGSTLPVGDPSPVAALSPAASPSVAPEPEEELPASAEASRAPFPVPTQPMALGPAETLPVRSGPPSGFGKTSPPPRVKPPVPARGGGDSASGPVLGEGGSLGGLGEAVSAVFNPPPVYPDKARRAHWEGTVELEVLIRLDGGVDGVRVLSSCGHALLDEAALDAVRGWRFAPRSGAGGPTRHTLPVTFVLEKP